MQIIILQAQEIPFWDFKYCFSFSEKQYLRRASGSVCSHPVKIPYKR